MLRMTGCCHCGTTLTYYQSIRRGCGSWCYSNRGGCRSTRISHKRGDGDERELTKMKIAKSFAKATLISAALGVSCLLAHGVCIIMTFIKHHNYFKDAATTIYSALRNKSEDGKYPLGQAVQSSTLEASSAGAVDKISNRMGDSFSEIAHSKFGISREWAREIGKETSRGMLEHGASTAFDWTSKAMTW